MKEIEILVAAHDLMESNGKTIKENNLEKKHNIPLGSLVEVEIQLYDTCAEGIVDLHGICKLYVVSHDRDCDGSPLYTVSIAPIVYPDNIRDRMKYKSFFFVESGYSEENLCVISNEITRLSLSIHDFFNFSSLD